MGRLILPDNLDRDSMAQVRSAVAVGGCQSC
jgi:hypothetical protein